MALDQLPAAFGESWASAQDRWNRLRGILAGKDWGLVTALPVKASVGDVCRYIADKTNGVIWNLIYDGEGEYPWKKIGGAPLHAVQATERSITSEEYKPLTEPVKLTLPLKGDYDIAIAAWCVPITTSELGSCRLSYAVGATAAADDWCLLTQVSAKAGGIQTHEKKHRHVGLASGTVVEEKARSSFGGASSFKYRHLWADPIRVG